MLHCAGGILKNEGPLAFYKVWCAPSLPIYSRSLNCFCFLPPSSPSPSPPRPPALLPFSPPPFTRPRAHSPRSSASARASRSSSAH